MNDAALIRNEDNALLHSGFEDLGQQPTEARHGSYGLIRFSRAVVALLLKVLMIALAISPMVFGIVYYGFLASPRYVSEARFVVKTAARPNIGGGLAAFLQMTGVSRAQDDTFAVQDFIMSRAAATTLPQNVDLRSIYGKPETDRLSRYPNIFYGESDEELHQYMQSMVSVVYNPNTSISTLKVEAFSAKEAQMVASALLMRSEDVVNRINTRIRDDSILNAEKEVGISEQRVIEAQVAITDFRNREMMIDPAASSLVVLELVAQLSTELSRTRAMIAQMQAESPNSPQLPSLIGRADALEQQVSAERSRISNTSDGLANKISVYERLVIERELSERILSTAIASLEGARTEARRQQLYLQRIVEPTLPDKALEPRRIFTIFSFIAGNLILLLVIWLLRTGVNTHAFSMRNKG
jgi:capsular polysaccharide transport system permease protein